MTRLGIEDDQMVDFVLGHQDAPPARRSRRPRRSGTPSQRSRLRNSVRLRQSRPHEIQIRHDPPGTAVSRRSIGATPLTTTAWIRSRDISLATSESGASPEQVKTPRCITSRHRRRASDAEEAASGVPPLVSMQPGYGTRERHAIVGLAAEP